MHEPGRFALTCQAGARETPASTVCEGEADVCAMGGCRGNAARAPVQRACGPSALTLVTPLDPPSAGGEVAVLREELSAFQPLLALSMLMTVSADTDEILRLATSSMTSLAPCRLAAVRLDGAWWPDPSRSPHHAQQLEAELARLGGRDGEVRVGDSRGWGFPLVTIGGVMGHIVVSSRRRLADHHRFLVAVLIQHAAAALANARLQARQQATLDELQVKNRSLEQSMAATEQARFEAQRSLDIHRRLTAAATAGEGEQGIASAVHELTGLPVVVEDRHGNRVVWAGHAEPPQRAKPSPSARERLLRRAVVGGGSIRDHGRLLSVARSGEEVVGVIVLLDPDGTAGPSDWVALEHATTVLTLELARRRAVAETELRLGRDLVEELLSGTESRSIEERARLLGYDLARPHRVVVVEDDTQRASSEDLLGAVRRAARDTGVGSLHTARGTSVVVLSHGDHDWERFRATVSDELGGKRQCRIGVGGRCPEPPDFPRSLREAQRAVRLQRATASPESATRFEDLGVYKLLADLGDVDSVEGFERRWLGRLLDYDAAKGTKLVETVAAYVECGGNYDATADALYVHRSTLRYRLQRLREISGLDLNDPDTRFNLQLATRAWTTLRALRQGSHSPTTT